MNHIKAVLFDVGGVLHESNTALDEDLIDELNIDASVLEKMRSDEIELLGLGKIDEQEFWKREHEKYGVRPVTLGENLLGRAFGKALKPHASILAFTKELKTNGIKIAILSNTIEPHAAALRDAGIYEGFDYIFLSHELGMRKPDAAIYKYATSQLKIEPEEIIFVDDILVNVQAAEALGMQGVVFTNEDEVIKRIKSIISETTL